MLLQLIAQRPQIVLDIVRDTPFWVWPMLGALVVLGLSQARARKASLARIMIMPVAMSALSLWGMVSAFSASPLCGYVLLAWFTIAATVVGVIGSMPPPAATSYDAATRTFSLPGSWVPLALILAIFLTKYGVGVETAMNQSLAADGPYTVAVGMLYGVFSGIFAGRATRLLRMALRGGPRAALA